MSEEKDPSQKRTWRDMFGRRRSPIKMSAARRRLLVRLGIALLVVVVFAVVPGYIASQPRFMQRYTSVNTEYQTWSTSVHAQVPCQRCHVNPGFVSQTGYSLRMLGEFYVSAVARSRQPKFLSKPVNAACQSCHIDLRTVSPSGDLNIPHRAHVSVLKLDCVKCHAYLVHQASPEGRHTPRMAMCLTCHDGRQAKNACSTCHTRKGIPESHKAANWVVIHPQMQTKIDCKKCHGWTANWCAECHTRRPRSHGTDWRAKHRVKVKAHRNCEACHKSPFCIRCHGEVPSLNLNPILKFVTQ